MSDIIQGIDDCGLPFSMLNINFGKEELSLPIGREPEFKSREERADEMLLVDHCYLLEGNESDVSFDDYLINTGLGL